MSPIESDVPTSSAWQVLVVEDDAEVAGIYEKAVGAVPCLEVAAVVASAYEALTFIQRHRCDLLLLDLQLPAGMDGLTLLRKMRAGGHQAEVIVLTASNSSGAVRSAIQHGAIDYLVKPFEIERLRQALGMFLNRVGALHGDRLAQDVIDRVCAAGRIQRRWLPKGLTDHGLLSVRKALAAGDQLSTLEVSERTGQARVTARRYLEYLVATDQVKVQTVAVGPGRPRKLYRSMDTGLNGRGSLKS